MKRFVPSAWPPALRRGLLPALAALALLGGCPAVYPEVGTQLRGVRPGQPLEPGPPENLRWIRFESAHVPERTRDGRSWGQVFGKLPDPYAKLFINGKELIRTPVQSDTLEPTWPNGPKGNFKIDPEDKLRVELWDANTLNDRPIGVREVGRLTREQLEDRRVPVELEGGARLVLRVEPAHAMSGLGLWYELRTDSCFVTRMLEGSPARRAGIEPGDEVMRIAKRDVKQMTPDEIRSAFNAVPMAGLVLTLRHKSGTMLDVTLKEGAVYPLYEQFGPVE
jgi:hypothetical protein